MKKNIAVSTFFILLTFLFATDNTNKMQIIKVGDFIKTDSFEIFIKSINFSYSVEPEKKGMFYSHYPADTGKVYIDIILDVKNIQKQNLDCSAIAEIQADYNDGYMYTAFPIIENKQIGLSTAHFENIIPLDTRTIHFLILCPQEVENTNFPLFLIFTIKNNKYKLVIR